MQFWFKIKTHPNVPRSRSASLASLPEKSRARQPGSWCQPPPLSLSVYEADHLSTRSTRRRYDPDSYSEGQRRKYTTWPLKLPCLMLRHSLPAQHYRSFPILSFSPRMGRDGNSHFSPHLSQWAACVSSDLMVLSPSKPDLKVLNSWERKLTSFTF